MENNIVMRYYWKPEVCLESLALNNEEVYASIQNEELIEEENEENFEENDSRKQEDPQVPKEDVDEQIITLEESEDEEKL